MLHAQQLTGAPADPQLKYSTPMPPGVASPDKVETRFGTLNFFDGFPDKASAEKLYYFMAIAMEEKLVGKGSQYAWTGRDADGNALDGGKNYKLHLPPNIPVKDFWSVILYSNQTRSMTQTVQRFPSVSSQTKGLLVNDDDPSADCSNNHKG